MQTSFFMLRHCKRKRWRILKRLFLWFLLLCVLQGCASAPDEAQLLQHFANLPGATFHAKIFSDTDTLKLEYELDYVYNKDDSDTLTITAPEILSGITATISGAQKAEFTLQYGDTILDTPSISKPGLTPVDCIARLLYALRACVPTEIASESADGVALAMLKYEDSAQEEGIIRQIWVDTNQNIPVRAEVYVGGQQILQCSFSDWVSLTSVPSPQPTDTTDT